jgi:hypothetical protein
LENSLIKEIDIDKIKEALLYLGYLEEIYLDLK